MTADREAASVPVRIGRWWALRCRWGLIGGRWSGRCWMGRWTHRIHQVEDISGPTFLALTGPSVTGSGD